MVEIKLGMKVKDLITGFEGIAISKVKYYNGCTQYCVMPAITDKSKRPDGEYIDEGQLKIIGRGLLAPKKHIKNIKADDTFRPGGDMGKSTPSTKYMG